MSGHTPEREPVATATGAGVTDVADDDLEVTDDGWRMSRTGRDERHAQARPDGVLPLDWL